MLSKKGRRKEKKVNITSRGGGGGREGGKGIGKEDGAGSSSGLDYTILLFHRRWDVWISREGEGVLSQS